jgi:hypothetical protein
VFDRHLFDLVRVQTVDELHHVGVAKHDLTGRYDAGKDADQSSFRSMRTFLPLTLYPRRSLRQPAQPIRGEADAEFG